MTYGAYHIIGLIALTGEHRDAEGLYHLVYPRDIQLYFLGHGITASLVFSINLMPECRLWQVERHPHMGWMLGTYDVVQPHGKAQHSRGIQPL